MAPETAGDTPERVSWEELDRLVERLAAAVGGRPDLLLAVTRGGLVPAGMLAYRLGAREILVAGVALYGDDGAAAEAPRLLHFPEPALLRGRRVLVVDEVWETGRTLEVVVGRVADAGGRPTTAVLHYKPARSRVALQPDHYAATSHRWVIYPYKAGA